MTHEELGSRVGREEERSNSLDRLRVSGVHEVVVCRDCGEEQLGERSRAEEGGKVPS